MGIFDTDFNPAMRYESLAREVFECGKYNDPFQNAHQEVFSRFIEEPEAVTTKRMLSNILVAAIGKFLKDPDKVQGLKSLDDRVWESSSQDEYIDIIDEAIKIVNA